MSNTDERQLSEFQYDLPDDRIARFPLAERDQSKLLVYRKGEISHDQFFNLPNYLPDSAFLVFNDTKVIPARLYFTKPTGALIELFLLNPLPAEQPIAEAMVATGSAIWQCMIGNRKRWKPTESLQTQVGDNTLTAHWHDYEQSAIRFEWHPISGVPDGSTVTFAEVIQQAGEIPLPPYLKREVTEADRVTYQTIYSQKDGAVAAPTAGLHFTPAVFDALAKQGIAHDYLTLHVGAGTFQPIKVDDIRQHQMHTEQVVYTQANLQHLLTHIDQLIPVGTTSLRALESLYWIGVKVLRHEANPFHLDQHYAYRISSADLPTPTEALTSVLRYMQEHNQPSLVAHTGIYITPGYRLKMVQGIITNFHQPGSTLILLISALIGDAWRSIYKEALDRDYRFLSYGDSSLLLP